MCAAMWIWIGFIKYSRIMIEGHGDDIYRYGALRCNFSSNISPLIDTSGLRQYLAKRLEVISHYPEPSAHSLEVLLANEYHIQPEEILVTSGATDAIYLIAQMLRDEGTFAVKRPTFSEYADACRMFGYQEAPKGGAVRWLCNPNNPTGEVYPLEKLQNLSRRHHWLVIDQSYEDCTFCKMLSPQESIEMQNVIQIHSMTKSYAVPGLRLGYITAHEILTAQIRQHLRPWSVSALAIEAGKYLLEHDELICKPDLREAQRLAKELEQIWGIVVTPSQTNFMLCRLVHHTAAELKDYLAQEHHLLIRDASNFRGLTPHHFRVASQTPAENDALVDAIKQFITLKNG